MATEKENTPPKLDLFKVSEVVKEAKKAGLEANSYATGDAEYEEFAADKDGNRVFSRESTSAKRDEWTTSGVVVNPIESGTAEYDSRLDHFQIAEHRGRALDTPVAGEARSTTIVRTDSDGNEVYRFQSNNPELADKVGALAARRIVDAANTEIEDKAA